MRRSRHRVRREHHQEQVGQLAQPRDALLHGPAEEHIRPGGHRSKVHVQKYH